MEMAILMIETGTASFDAAGFLRKQGLEDESFS